MSTGKNQLSTRSSVATAIKVRMPKMYKVLLHNDDFTPMEFVVNILQQIFGKDHTEATRVMLDVHQKGFGVCGVFTLDIAETKTASVLEIARQNDHPLKCTTEEA